MAKKIEAMKQIKRHWPWVLDWITPNHPLRTFTTGRLPQKGSSVKSCTGFALPQPKTLTCKATGKKSGPPVPPSQASLSRVKSQNLEMDKFVFVLSLQTQATPQQEVSLQGKKIFQLASIPCMSYLWLWLPLLMGLPLPSLPASPQVCI